MIKDLKKFLSKIKIDNLPVIENLDWNSELPFLVSESFVSRMRHGDFNDPLLRQVLPLLIERQTFADYITDPLAEAASSPFPGLIHKYCGRVLLMVTNDCAMNCRFCFRRHLRAVDLDWDRTFDYLANDFTISEVILSGGDPLMLSNLRLQTILASLAKIPHLKRVRIHTRIPVVLPERVNDDLIQSLTATRFCPVIVVHCNHANEIDDGVIAALHYFQQAGMMLLNQSVLLGGVNDDVDTLIALSEKLFLAGVVPYYLHLLDQVAGAAHFAVDSEKVKLLQQGLARKLPGYLVPRFQKAALSNIHV